MFEIRSFMLVQRWFVGNNSLHDGEEELLKVRDFMVDPTLVHLLVLKWIHVKKKLLVREYLLGEDR